MPAPESEAPLRGEAGREKAPWGWGQSGSLRGERRGITLQAKRKGEETILIHKECLPYNTAN